MKLWKVLWLLLALVICNRSIAQEKWVPLIQKLDSLEEGTYEYAKVIVGACWQISDLSPDSAIYYGEIGLKLADDFGSDSIRCRSLIGLSAAVSRMSKHSQSIEYSLEALRIAESIKDTSSIFDASNNIGIDKYYLGEMESSLEYFKISAEKIKDFRKHTPKSRHQYATALMNVALVEAELGNTENELATYYDVLQAFLDVKDERNYALTLFNMGKSFYGLKEYDSAELYFKRSSKIFHERQWTSAESDVLTAWAKMLLDQGQFDQAMKQTYQSLSLANKTNNVLQEQFAFDLLHRIYREIGQFDSAYHYQSKYQELYNESREKEKQENADELLAKYETEKKEQQIAQLEQENQISRLKADQQKQMTIIAVLSAGLLLLAILFLYARYHNKKKSNALLDAKNQELAKLNTTKDRLFSIISHDLKSPLSSFHTITSSLTDNWEAIDKDQLKGFIESLRDSSADVKNMMDNLLKWALSQSQQLTYKPTEVDLSELVAKVKSELSAVSEVKNIEVNIESKSNESIQADIDYLQIIIRNLLSNAIKFSDMNARIDCLVKEQNHSKIIKIQDYGVGMDQQQANQLFAGEILAHDIKNSTEKGTGLGLVLCKELMLTMNGEIQVTTEKGKGTTFTLIFPQAA